MELDRVAQLAHLKLTEAEQAALAGQLDQILAMVAQLKTVDTTGVPPFIQAGAVQQPPRADDNTSVLDREAVLQAAPESDGAAFGVPYVLGGEG